MIFLVMGLPGPLTGWCAEVACAASRSALKTVDMRPVSRLEDVARLALTSTAECVIGVAPMADDALGKALEEAAAPPVIVLDDPATAFLEVMARENAPPLDTLRFVLRGCVNLTEHRDLSGALVLTRALIEADPAAAAERIAAHFGMAPPLSPPDFPDTAPQDAEARATALRSACGDTALGDAILAVLDAFPRGVLSDEGPALSLGAPLFHEGVHPHPLLNGPLDLTGRARVLFHGLYAALPTGHWDLVAHLAVDDAATEGRYRFEVRIVAPVEQTLGEATLRFGAPGAAALMLSFTHRSPEAALEFRMLSEHAVFDGFMELHRIVLTRRRPESREGFVAP
jgi:hypothetical protein